jgi:hypothetical protein
MDELEVRYQKSWAVPQDLFADDEYFTNYLCQFGWLKDLKATGDMSARRLARRLIEHWYDKNLCAKTKKKLKKTENFVMTERLSNFLLLYDFFGASADDSFKRIFFKNIQIEYRLLKSRHRKDSPIKLSMLKVLIEFNVYCEYDASFFELLLTEIGNEVQKKRHVLTSNKLEKITDVYRDFCTVIEIRNALIQWEKAFFEPHKSSPYSLVFVRIQEYLHNLMQFIRFFRHSNGKLCRLTSTKSDCFFEQILSSDIDIALSQVESSATSQENEVNGIVRLANKQSVVFVQADRQIINNERRINSMSFEWSYQSYDVVHKSSVAIIRNHARRACISDVTTTDGTCFSGIVTDNGDSYVFRRELTLQKNSLHGTDTFLVDDATMNAFVAIEFVTDWTVVEVNHEEQSRFGEVALCAHKTSKKSKLLCTLRVENEQLFGITIRTDNDKRIISIISPLSSGIPDCITWSLHIGKITTS